MFYRVFKYLFSRNRKDNNDIVKKEYFCNNLYIKDNLSDKEKFENINRENHINNVDERKVFLRMKAGSLVYQIMTFVYLFVAFVFALLHIEAWIIGVIFGLFLLQTFLGIVLYKHFEKHF